MSIRAFKSPNLDITETLRPKARPDGLGGDLLATADDALSRMPEKPQGPQAGDRLELTASTEPRTSLSDIAEKAREAQVKPEIKAEAKPEAPPETKPETKPETTPEKPLRPGPRKTPAMLAQEEAISRAIAGEPAGFTALDGKPILVQITRQGASKSDGPSGPRDDYRLAIEGSEFDVRVARNLDPKEPFAKMVEYFSKVPEHVRPALKSVELETVPNPQDAYWATVYGRDTFTSAATAGGGNITFWNLNENPYNLNEGHFNHEMAHLIGSGYSTSKTRHAEMVPPGWEDAVKADGNRVSEYAGSNANEDFSETWRYYLEARKSPEALAAFQEKYPNRTRILEAIFRGDFEGKFKVSQLDVERLELPGREGARLA